MIYHQVALLHFALGLFEYKNNIFSIKGIYNILLLDIGFLHFNNGFEAISILMNASLLC
jgi:hypothetical protein